jgi:hypothetical protein
MNAQEQAAFYAKVGGLIGLDPALVALNRGRIGEASFPTTCSQRRAKRSTSTTVRKPATSLRRRSGTMWDIAPRTINVFYRCAAAALHGLRPEGLGLCHRAALHRVQLEEAVLWDRKSSQGTPQDLAVALTQNTDLKALVLNGFHDLGANYMLARYLLEQTVRSPSARSRLSFRTYPGGHMFYLRKNSRAELAADVRQFFETPP